MNLVPDWRVIARRAHSMWAQYLAVLCLIAPDLIYLLAARDTNPRLWWCLALVLSLYGLFGRLIRQRNIPDRTTLRSPWIICALVAIVAVVAFFNAAPEKSRSAAVTAIPADPPVPQSVPDADAAFLALAVPFVGEWEGLRLTAYRDPVGIWTVCYGETKGVKPGDTYTRAECDAMLAREIIAYRDGLDRHFLPDTRATRLPVSRHVAFASLAYNVGVAAAGKSTAVRRLNAGRVTGACDALTWWNKAGGRVLRGLVRRRAAEFDLCMAGVA